MSWHNATQNGSHLLTDGIDVSSTDLVRPSYIWWGSSQGVYNNYWNTDTQRGRCQDTLKQIGKNTLSTGVDKAAQNDPLRHGQTNSNGQHMATQLYTTHRQIGYSPPGRPHQTGSSCRWWWRISTFSVDDLVEETLSSCPADQVLAMLGPMCLTGWLPW